MKNLFQAGSDADTVKLSQVMGDRFYEIVLLWKNKCLDTNALIYSTRLPYPSGLVLYVLRIHKFGSYYFLIGICDQFINKGHEYYHGGLQNVFIREVYTQCLPP